MKRHGRHVIGLWLAAGVMLAGCATTSPASRPAQYDLGALDGALAGAPASPASPRPVVVLAPVDATAPLDGPRMWYRLAYDEPRRLQAFALSAWTAAPADLVRQRLALALGARWTVLGQAQALAQSRSTASTDLILRLELLEFAQHFSSPSASAGRLRLRATLLRPGDTGPAVAGQRILTFERPATRPDAAAGVAALAQAVDAAAQDLAAWLATQAPS